MPVIRKNGVLLKFSDEELARVEINKKASGYNQRAKFIRDLALNDVDSNLLVKSVVEKTVPKEIAIELNKIGNNINQIAKNLNINSLIFTEYMKTLPDNERVDFSKFKFDILEHYENQINKMEKHLELIKNALMGE